YVGAGDRDNIHSYTFERYLLMLFGLKGLQKGYKYSMATELRDAGKFDNVVFHYIREGGQLCTRLLQARHFTDQSKEITVEDLLEKSANSRFGLKTYFKSYLKIQAKFTKELEFTEELELILCTNIDLKFKKNSKIPKLLRRKTTYLRQYGYLYFE